MEEQKVRELLVACGNELLDQGLVARTWGNISCRLDEKHMLVTPSGLDYRSLKPEDIAVMDLETMEWTGPHKPSSEKGVHAEAYRVCPDAQFVIHTHQEYATALGLCGCETMDISEDEKKELGGIAKAAYGLSGTKKLTNAVKAAFESGAQTVFMPHHGVVIAGKSKEETMEKALLLDRICRRNCRAEISSAPCESIQPDGSRGHAEDGFISAIRKVYPHSAVVCTPAAMAAAAKKEPIYAQVDDMAQMIGKVIPCAAGAEEQAVLPLLQKFDAVLLPGIGAAVKAENEDDCEAMGILLEKAALCHLHTLAAGKEKECRLGGLDVALQHVVYIKKYSRQKK
jgi:L-ribulose-5-phosphate 4-epimerase